MIKKMQAVKRMDACGVLFDMDGVLVDSEPVITRAAKEALIQLGIPAMEQDFKPFTGMGEVRFLGGVAEMYGREYEPRMKDMTYAIYAELVDEHLKVYENTHMTLAYLKARGVRLALASSADRVKVDHNLRVARIPKNTFSAIITAEDVQRKKPFPDIFLRAAEGIGVTPERCVVVEDAVAGVEAGKAAGAKVIAVLTSFRQRDLALAGADLCVIDIGDVPDAYEQLMES